MTTPNSKSEAGAAKTKSKKTMARTMHIAFDESITRYIVIITSVIAILVITELYMTVFFQEIQIGFDFCQMQIKCS